MDTLISLAGPLAGLIGAFLLWRSSKRAQDKTGEVGFRTDLLKSIEQLKSEQRKDAELIERLRTSNDQLWADNRKLREQVFNLERRLAAFESGHPTGGAT